MGASVFTKLNLKDTYYRLRIKRAGVLPPYNRYNHAIKLEGGEPLYGPLYNLLVTEL